MKVWVDDCEQWLEPTLDMISIVAEKTYNFNTNQEEWELYKIENYKDEFGNKVKVKTYIGSR